MRPNVTCQWWAHVGSGFVAVIARPSLSTLQLWHTATGSVKCRARRRSQYANLDEARRSYLGRRGFPLGFHGQTPVDLAKADIDGNGQLSLADLRALMELVVGL